MDLLIVEVIYLYGRIGEVLFVKKLILFVVYFFWWFEFFFNFNVDFLKRVKFSMIWKDSE